MTGAPPAGGVLSATRTMRVIGAGMTGMVDQRALFAHVHPVGRALARMSTPRYRRRMRGTRVMAATAGTLVLGIASPPIPAQAGGPEVQTTTLLSRAADGTPGDAPSQHPAISHDARAARVVAFDSAATNLVPGDTNGASDVFVITRNDPFGPDGDAWSPGAVRLVSHGLDGAPADGPSSLPQLSGDSRTPPRCLAFVSAASNLVTGDTNGKPDAFVADLATGAITRVSVGSDGRQSNGATTAVSVDGRCRRVAFIADATNLAAVRGRTPSSKAMATAPEPAGSRQVYVRGIGGTSILDRALTGVTWVVSRRPDGKPSNGVASGLMMTSNEAAVAFDSTAPDLARDVNGTSDVFLARMTRRLLKKVHHRRPQAVSVAVSLVSAAGGAAGNGPSSQPAVNPDGSRVAFTTGAADLAAGASATVTQVVRADTPAGGAPQLRLVSQTGGTPGDGPSEHPSLTAASTWVLYDTAAQNLQAGAALGGMPQPRAVIRWYDGDNTRWLISDDSDERQLPGESSTPVTSPHGNYIVFVNGGQVLLRYLGPK